MSFEALRRHCATLPGATMDVKWGADECWSVGGKMFAVFGVENGRARNVSFKCDPDRFLELTDQPGVVPAPYLARAHWVQVADATALPPATAKRLIARSHELVAAKLTKKAREAALAAPRARS
jgi:predicted DNA-binding protein (MmcQ/YjbR family)